MRMLLSDVWQFKFNWELKSKALPLIVWPGELIMKVESIQFLAYFPMQYWSEITKYKILWFMVNRARL